MFLARVGVEKTAFGFDRLFDYIVPADVDPCSLMGKRVLVQFGNGRSLRQGFVFETDDVDGASVQTDKLKPIKKVLDKEPLLTEELVLLAGRIARRTFSTYFDSCRALLPTGLFLDTFETYKWVGGETKTNTANFSADEIKIAEYLSSKDGFIPQKKLEKDLKLENSSELIKALIDDGLVIKNTETSRRLNDAVEVKVRLSYEFDDFESLDFKPTKKQRAVLELLRETPCATTREICYFTGVTASVVETLKRKGVLEYEEEEVFRKPDVFQSERETKEDFNLTKEQSDALEKLHELLVSDKKETCLLFGVTGSGKTNVYMKLIDEAVNLGGVIVLVPEISLTPQLLSLFYSRYGDKVAVLHSALSVGERMDEWKRIKQGMANIVIGTRSAVFAPLKKIALIVIDEEQESTYKSEMSPRYDARDAASFRISYNSGLLLLSSATPSVKTFAMARKGFYHMVELKNRYSDAGLPEVMTADMTVGEEGYSSPISRSLYEELNKNLENKEKSILMLNRRGYNTFAACTKCKGVMTCPNCSISLTYHSANGRLMCHYCGYSSPLTAVCPLCGGETVRFSGFGTQRVESELKRLFPDISILRMDADTTSSKGAHERSFNDFASGKYDVLLGTQMIAKGLDFPSVTLVGVISVDQQLYNDDFRSSERAFDLLTQVVGRAGRGEKHGRAVIQTMEQGNEIIHLATKQDYVSFYESEIKIRRALVYPPFCNLCVVGFSSLSETMSKTAASAFLADFKSRVEEEPDIKVIVMGPVAPRISKMNNYYRQRVIIKCIANGPFIDLISQSLKVFSKNKAYNKVRVFADIDPETIL